MAGGTSVHMSTPLRFGVRATLNAPEMTHSCRRNGKGNVGRHSRPDSILPYGVALRLLRVVQKRLGQECDPYFGSAKQTSRLRAYSGAEQVYLMQIFNQGNMHSGRKRSQETTSSE